MRNHVRELRKIRGWTKADLAEKAGVALRTIHNVEKGKNVRSLTKTKILMAFGMRWDSANVIFLSEESIE